MPLSCFSSGSSSLSDSDRDAIFDAKEVGKRLKLDSKTVKWLKQRPADGEDQVLVLSYQNEFLNLGNCDANKQIVSTGLTNSGATRISDNVFKFDHWNTIYTAHHQMLYSMRRFFYFPDPVTAQRFDVRVQPTIETVVIARLPEIPGKLEIVTYPFFQL